MATNCTNKDGRLSPDKDAPLLRKSLTIKRILNCDFQHLGVFDGPYSPTKSLLLPRDENRASIAIAPHCNVILPRARPCQPAFRCPSNAHKAVQRAGKHLSPSATTST